MSDTNEMEKMLMDMIKSGKITKETLKSVSKECNKKVVEKKYIPYEKYDEGEKENPTLRITDYELWKNKIIKDKEIINNILTDIYNDTVWGEKYNSYKLEDLEIKTDTKKVRKEDNMDEDNGNRCYGMVWGGGKGGRCKSCIVDKDTKLCKLHYNNLTGNNEKNKKLLLSYGYYNITGEGSVPDLDGKALTRNKNNSLDYEKEEDLLLLKPLTEEIFTKWESNFPTALCIYNELKKYKFNEKECKRLNNLINKHYDIVSEGIVIKTEYPTEIKKEKLVINEIMEEEEEEENNDSSTEEEEEEKVEIKECIRLMNERLELNKEIKSYEKELGELKIKKRKSKEVKKKIEELTDLIIYKNEEYNNKDIRIKELEKH